MALQTELETAKEILRYFLRHPQAADTLEGVVGNRGRLQFFFHSPSSRLPVRDVLGKGKTEPHFEKQAENYCAKCYQRNIQGFLNHAEEKYLFLFTRCRNKKMKKCYSKRFIVGYIVKKRRLRRGPDWWAVQGPTMIFSFKDAYPLNKVTKHPRHVRVMKLDRRQTERVLGHFAGKRNILTQCLRELARLKRTKKRGMSRCG